MKTLLTIILVAVVTFAADAQIRITRTEELPLSRSRHWSNPQFSPNGRSVFYTDGDGNGIWEYSLQDRTSRRITEDPKSGFAFSLSQDGMSLVYRRTSESGQTRTQEIVMMNLARRTSSVLATGPDVSNPSFSGNTPVYTVRSKTSGLAPTTARAVISVLGIENTKIALNVGGRKVIVDPHGNGSYVWPEISPDNRRLVAYEMDRGAFVCDLDGANLIALGRRNAPSWARSGRWIIYMDDRDDGHRLLASDLWAISPDGSSSLQLTMTRQTIELNPRCSPTENKIVCSTADGSILVFEYEEQQ
ncbi:MAG: hypothetical protein A2X66_05950 [Ignavibacteria bacterium GWA2_54_16]|nr:MAG: hypothetical protein A2X66_05950 [Ignavibacteria bacterium GWA2_54_16]